MTYERNAVIEFARLGLERGAFLTLHLQFDYGTSSQGWTSPCLAVDRSTGLDVWDKGFQFIVNVLHVVGVEYLHQLEGKPVIALLDSDAWGAMVVGVKHFPDGTSFDARELDDDA